MTIITGKANDIVKVNVTALPNGATGNITATVAAGGSVEGLAEASDNGDGTWNVTLKKAGTGSVTFKSGAVQTVVNVNVTD